MTQLFAFNDVPDASMAEAAGELFELIQQEPDYTVALDLGDSLVAYFVATPVEGEDDEYDFSEYLMVGDADPVRVDGESLDETADSTAVIGLIEQRLHFLLEVL